MKYTGTGCETLLTLALTAGNWGYCSSDSHTKFRSSKTLHSTLVLNLSALAVLFEIHLLFEQFAVVACDREYGVERSQRNKFLNLPVLFWAYPMATNLVSNVTSSNLQTGSLYPFLSNCSWLKGSANSNKTRSFMTIGLALK